MKIEFDKTPDPTGLGRVIVDGKYYGLPAEAVTYLGIVSALTAEWQQKLDKPPVNP